MEEQFENRKKRVKTRLSQYGLEDSADHHQGYFGFTSDIELSPFDVGSRMIILYSIACATQDGMDRAGIKEWLMAESLWERASDREKQFLENEKVSEESRSDLSWRFESAYVLAWVLNIIPELSPPVELAKDDEMKFFIDSLPPLGGHLEGFLKNLSFRSEEEIVEEHMFTELVTAYFHKLLFAGQENNTAFHPMVTYERYEALNWIYQGDFKGNWDSHDGMN